MRLQEDCLSRELVQIEQINLYLRYQTTHEKSFSRCLNDLLKLKEQRRKEQIGSVSQ
jgi:hypothetical protein